MLKTAFLYGLMLGVVGMSVIAIGGETTAGSPGSTIVIRPAATKTPMPLPKVDTAARRTDPYYTTGETTGSATVAEPDDSEMVTIVHDANAAHRYPTAHRCSHPTTCVHCRVTCRDRMQARWAEKKACLQYSHWGYPELFEERPLGEPICAHLKAQATNGLLADMALYRYDFSNVPGSDESQLNTHGLRRLHQVARRFQCNLYPLVIEASPDDPELDATRRANVIAALENCIGEVPDEWVVIGRPKYSTLRDEELVEIYTNLLQNTVSRGNQARAGMNNSLAPNLQALPQSAP